MTRSRVWFVAIATAFVAFLFASGASALPRFAAREGVPCVTCHVNPSGGGMRNRYGRYVYAPTALPMFYPRVGAPLNVDIGDTLAFGADSRTAYVNINPPQNVDTISTIFQMQGNLYVGAQLYPGVTLYYNEEAYGSFEAMGIWQQDFGRPDMSMYVKAGRFMPTYGLRLENHNVYTRQDIGFGPRAKDQGAEVGVYLGPLLVQGSVLNGSDPEKQLDENRSKAFVGRVEVLPSIGKLHLMLGGSAYANETGTMTTTGGTQIDARVKHYKVGGHWGAGIGRFAYLGEFDIVTDQPFEANTQDSRVHGYQSYQELDVRIVRGLELNLNYEYKQPNLEVALGHASRIAGGFEVYPVPYVELKVLYRRTFADVPDSVPDPSLRAVDGLTEFIGMAHLYF